MEKLLKYRREVFAGDGVDNISELCRFWGCANPEESSQVITFLLIFHAFLKLKERGVFEKHRSKNIRGRCSCFGGNGQVIRGGDIYILKNINNLPVYVMLC